MTAELLTRDTIHLSEVTPALLNRFEPRFQLIAHPTEFSPETGFFLQNSVSANSRRAYESDLREFERGGGSIPASPEIVAEYLAQSANKLSVATLVRRLASISKAHEVRGFPNPTRSPFVRAILRGIKRTYGCAQRQAKPLLRDELIHVLDATGDQLRDLRDRALLLLGFAGALRRSELVGLNVGDVEHARQGVILHLLRSKSDQEARGEKIGIPFARGRWCPVAALEAWLAISGISEGPIFRPVDRHGRVHDGRLSGEAVGEIVRERVSAAGLDPSGYSGHSLRAGLATSASQLGVPTFKIREQTRHASDAMLARYVRDGAIFSQNAAGALL
ncbi:MULTISPECIES: tyrosine-type recombinase/integrase [unclassified Bradyrhizobium]|uniref:site-specific integrase n=1 Tax=unclassified Bradyrhizobium TaxID=2631580 RepID=UPI001FF7817D|nr:MULTISPECIES: tyrosine-type recombinase/integrase [unclassified Bradyrhizobium]MCK1271569.1 site-specific integrase [Bradyrhizobium sp. 84]MCK1373896.1 site-specific integrase [Bradyrhizobium sp. 49]MCK1416799.1 site-specific integrase [Bradyrhizobium sp. CW4]MCK1427780.1 site-specific integrase [Bradyrhizobium sp. 87]